MALFFTKAVLLLMRCICCLSLKSGLDLGPVSAAAVTGLLGSFLQLPRLMERDQLHAVIYTGAFIGMGSSEVLRGPTDAAGISLIGAGVFLFLRPIGVGIGGKMGTIAFISSLLFFFFRRAL